MTSIRNAVPKPKTAWTTVAKWDRVKLNGDIPARVFLTKLWALLGRSLEDQAVFSPSSRTTSADVAAIFSDLALLPSEYQTLYPLGITSSPLILQQGQDPLLVECLRALGCGTIDPDTRIDGRLLGQFPCMNSATPAGAVQALEAAFVSVPSILNAFESVPSTQRLCLFDYLASQQAWTPRQLQFISKLPIIPLCAPRCDEESAAAASCVSPTAPELVSAGVIDGPISSSLSPFHGAPPNETVVSFAAAESGPILPPSCMIFPSLLDELFVHLPLSANALKLLESLKIEEQSLHTFIAETVLPKLPRVSLSDRISIMRVVLGKLALVERASSSCVTRLKEYACIPTQSGKLAIASNLFDPNIKGVHSLVHGKDLFPAEDLCSRADLLQALIALGVQSNITLHSLVSMARVVESAAKEALANCERDHGNPAGDSVNAASAVSAVVVTTASPGEASDSKFPLPYAPNIDSGMHTAMQMAKAIMHHLCTHAKSLLRSDKPSGLKKLFGLGGDKPNALDGDLAELLQICWVPVLTSPPVPEMPWTKQLQSVFASPMETRLQSYAWLCSASLRIVAVDVPSELVVEKLGLNKPIPAYTIAQQLEALGTLNIHNLSVSARSTLSEHVPKLYEHLATYMDALDKNKDSAETMINVHTLLKDKPWVWTADGQFALASSVAFSSIINCSPYLHTLPQVLADRCGRLFSYLGVRKSFEPDDYALVLEELRRASDGKPLLPAQLSLSLFLLQHISENVGNLHASISVPDTQGTLVSVKEACYNDSPWLPPAQLRLVHPKISNAVAAAVGIKSALHCILSPATEGGEFEPYGQAESLTARLRGLLDVYPDGVAICKELIQNADDAGATRVAFIYSKQQFGKTSLLGEELHHWQGEFGA